jgi:exodeoxyribonuclease V alpha subunit
MTIEEALDKLRASKFRGRFKLTAADFEYINRVGTGTIERHAADFVRERLSDAEPKNDGKQTPMRGHPVFKAMHATAMCCRGCMEKWWRVKKGVQLTALQQQKGVNLIMAWIKMQMEGGMDAVQRKMT